VKQVRVDHRGKQVVRRRDGVEVTMKMKIDFLTRLDL
jgi:hypothetical protein